LGKSPIINNKSSKICYSLKGKNPSKYISTADYYTLHFFFLKKNSAQIIKISTKRPFGEMVLLKWPFGDLDFRRNGFGEMAIR